MLTCINISEIKPKVVINILIVILIIKKNKIMKPFVISILVGLLGVSCAPAYNARVVERSHPPVRRVEVRSNNIQYLNRLHDRTFDRVETSFRRGNISRQTYRGLSQELQQTGTRLNRQSRKGMLRPQEIQRFEKQYAAINHKLDRFSRRF